MNKQTRKIKEKGRKRTSSSPVQQTQGTLQKNRKTQPIIIFKQ